MPLNKHEIAGLPIPEIRRRLAADGYPCDLKTALRVRLAARSNKLAWTPEVLQTHDEHDRINFKPKR